MSLVSTVELLRDAEKNKFPLIGIVSKIKSKNNVTDSLYQLELRIS